MNENIVKLNASYRAHLLLFAWHALKIVQADRAEIIRLNENGFTVRVFVDTKSSDCVHLFSSKEKSQDISKSLERSLISQERVHLPPHTGHSLLLISVLLLCSLSYDHLPFFLHSTKQLFILLVRDDHVARMMVALAALTHFLEALYVVNVMRSVLNSFTHLLGWFLLTFVLGFPCTSRALTLSAALKTSRPNV